MRPNKALIESELIERKTDMMNEKNETYPHKSLNFRAKVKKSFPPLNPADELIKFSELMMKIVTKR